MKKHQRQIDPPTQIDVPGGITQHQFGQLKDLQTELTARRLEALKLYEPMPHQE